MLDELVDLVELHPRNNMNLCLSGGMIEVLSMILSHPDEAIRKKSCSVFTTVVSNNKEVQDFASKLGALNLSH